MQEERNDLKMNFQSQSTQSLERWEMLGLLTQKGLRKLIQGRTRRVWLHLLGTEVDWPFSSSKEIRQHLNRVNRGCDLPP